MYQHISQHKISPSNLKPIEPAGPVLKDNRSKIIQKVGIQNKKIIQLVSYNSTWKSQEAYYQQNKVGSKRIPGDAEWLAITRYTNGITIDPNKTVSEMLAEAKKIKLISFEDWKGSQSTGDSQEAQHLVSATYATKVLRWPYSFINSKHNGKMLLAGRKGKGKSAPKKYLSAKSKRGKTSSRGLYHIVKGIAHSRYERQLKQYIPNYYKKNGLVIGKKISNMHMQAIANYLRTQHKAFDGKTTTKGVDDLIL